MHSNVITKIVSWLHFSWTTLYINNRIWSTIPHVASCVEQVL